jgi:hypothetical protein
MSAAGDLRAVLTLDDFEYLTGMREAAHEADNLAEHVEHAGHSMHRAIHRSAHLAVGAAFMFSEGKGIDDFKSKLEQLAAIAPMVGLAIGGWAGPLGIAAGIAGAVLIPKLTEADEAFKAITDDIKEGGKALDEFIKRQQEMVAFQDKLRKTHGRDEFGKTKEDLDEDMKKAQVAEDALIDAARKAQMRVNGAAQARNAADEGPLGAVGGWFAGGEAQKALEAAEKERERVLSDLRKVGAEKAEIDEKRRQLGKEQAAKEEAGPSAIDPKFAIEQSKKLLELEEKRRQIAERIGKEIETPYDRAQEKIRELSEAYKEGIIDKETMEKGSQHAIDEYEKSQTKQGANAASMGGSSESYKQIRESVDSQSKVDDEKIRILKEQAEKQEKIVQGVDRIADNIRPLDVEGIA